MAADLESHLGAIKSDARVTARVGIGWGAAIAGLGAVGGALVGVAAGLAIALATALAALGGAGYRICQGLAAHPYETPSS